MGTPCQHDDTALIATPRVGLAVAPGAAAAVGGRLRRRASPIDPAAGGTEGRARQFDQDVLHRPGPWLSEPQVEVVDSMRDCRRNCKALPSA